MGDRYKLKKQSWNSILSILLIIMVIFSGFTTIFSNLIFDRNKNKREPAENVLLNLTYDNYCFINNVNQTEYFFNAKGPCYILAEVKGADFTSFKLDNENHSVSYGLNVFPKYFGENYTSHNITFEQTAIDNNYFDWITVEPLFLEENDIIVNLTTPYSTSFNASGAIAILIRPDFSYNWLYLEVDGIVINNIYNSSTYPDVDSAFYSYFMEEGSYLYFSLDMLPKEHSLRIMGNGSLKYKIMVNFDWDQDLISDVDEVQKELFNTQFDPLYPNVWGMFEKSSPLMYLHNKSGSAEGFYHFYIPDAYAGLNYLYIHTESGTISDIRVDKDELTLQNITLSKNHKDTPYGYLGAGHHFVEYNYSLNELTEISFNVNGKDILVLDEKSIRDSDCDGLKDGQEHNSGLDPFDSDTDNDGIPDNTDPSPLTSLVLDKDCVHQFVIPHDPNRSTLINLKIQKPDPDYTTSEPRLYLDGHYHGEGLNVSIYPVLRVFGNQSITRNAMVGKYKFGYDKYNTYSLVDTYDADSFGDAIPDPTNPNAEFTFIFTQQSEDVFEFDINYPKGHPAKDDNVIDLRFDLIWLVLYNVSGDVKLLHYYTFENDILLQAMTVREFGDVNYILGSPDSMIENQILWALTQNPILGTYADFNVTDDIIGGGTVDYLNLANQTLNDRINAPLGLNETEILYVAGVQSNYDVLNKLAVKNLENPSFIINNSGNFLFYFSFYSISNVYNESNYTLWDAEILGDDKICYAIGWDNYSSENSTHYTQTATILGLPIYMNLISFLNSKVLEITCAMGAEIPLEHIPNSTQFGLHDKIIFHNKTFIEISEVGQSTPLINFDEAKHTLKESFDNRQWQIEASKLIFYDYSGYSRTTADLFNKYCYDLNNAYLNVESIITQTSGLISTIELDYNGIWGDYEFTKNKLLDINELISDISLLMTKQLYDIKFNYAFEPIDNLFKEVTDHTQGIDLLYDVRDRLKAERFISGQKESVSKLKFLYRGLKGIATIAFQGWSLFDAIRILFENFTSGDWSGDIIDFALRITHSIVSIAFKAVALISGVLKFLSNFPKFLQHFSIDGLRSMAKTCAKITLYIGIILEILKVGIKLWETFTTYGLSPEFWIEFSFILLDFGVSFILPLILMLVFSTGIGIIIGVIVALIFLIWDWLFGAEEQAEEGEQIHPSIEIVWTDPDDRPLTYVDFPTRTMIRQGGLELYDPIDFHMAFHNNGDVPVGLVVMIGIPEADGSIDYYYYGQGCWWFEVDETDDFRHAELIKVTSPNLTLQFRLQLFIYLAHNDTVLEIYKDDPPIDIRFNLPVCPPTIAEFYALTDELPSPSGISNITDIAITYDTLFEIDPLIGWTPVNLTLTTKGYNDSVIECEISFPNETNFYTDTPNFTQSLFSNISFNLFSQSPNFLGGIYYFNISIRLNETGQLILTELVPFRISFLRNFTYSQSNVVYKMILNTYFSSSNISSPINCSSTNVDVGNVMFIKYKTNSTKEINMHLYNDSQLSKKYRITPRGGINRTDKFLQILIDENFTFNNITFSGDLFSSEYLMISEVTIINATVETPANEFFNPINFTNYGNVPEFVNFAFSGFPFEYVDTTLTPDEFDGTNQLICVMPGENRTCLFNISKPTMAISNLISRSLTATNPIIDTTYCRYTDCFAIDGIYIDNPKNTTHTIYDSENNESLWLNIITQEALVWSAYSLDDQALVNFTKNVYLPVPEDGLHKIQVFGKNATNDSFQSDVRYFTVNSALINIITPEHKIQYLLWSGIYNGTYGFENDKNGSKPSGWEATDGVYVVNHEVGHTKVVEISEDGNSLLCRDEFPRTSGTIEFWIKFVGIGLISYVSFEGGDSDFHPEILDMFLMSGRWYYHFNTTDWAPIPNIADPQVNIWHHLRMDFRCSGAAPYLGLSDDCYVVTFDGVSSGELPHCHTGRSAYEFFEIYISSGSDTQVWIDAVGFSWDPNYNIGDNYYTKSQFALPLEYIAPTYFTNLSYSIDYQSFMNLESDIIMFNGVGEHSLQLMGTDIFDDLYESAIRNFGALGVFVPTPSGDNISIFESYTNIEINITQVTTNGSTFISLNDTDYMPAFPASITIGFFDYTPSFLTTVYYKINDTSAVLPPIHSISIKIPYNESKVQLNEKNIRIFQYLAGGWYGITNTIDTENNVIVGDVIAILSDFLVIEILDDRPPITALFLNGSPATTWNKHASDVLVSLNASDGVSEVLETRYSFDGVNWTTYTGPFTLTTEGMTDFYYYSMDTSNNIEGISLKNIIIDKTAPSTEISFVDTVKIEGSTYYITGTGQIRLIGSDEHTHVEHIYYSIDGGPFVEYNQWLGMPIVFQEPTGTYTFSFYSVDFVGNVEPLNTITIEVVTYIHAFLIQLYEVYLRFIILYVSLAVITYKLNKISNKRNKVRKSKVVRMLIGKSKKLRATIKQAKKLRTAINKFRRLILRGT